MSDFNRKSTTHSSAPLSCANCGNPRLRMVRAMIDAPCGVRAVVSMCDAGGVQAVVPGAEEPTQSGLSVLLECGYCRRETLMTLTQPEGVRMKSGPICVMQEVGMVDVPFRRKDGASFKRSRSRASDVTNSAEPEPQL